MGLPDYILGQFW